MEQILTLIEANVLGGVGFALFAVLVGTKVADVGLRDYIFILTIAVLGAANVIEHWFTANSFVTSCLIGFSIGFLADDVYLNLKATVPDFVKQIVNDIFQGVKDWVHKIIGKF